MRPKDLKMSQAVMCPVKQQLQIELHCWQHRPAAQTVGRVVIPPMSAHVAVPFRFNFLSAALSQSTSVLLNPQKRAVEFVEESRRTSLLLTFMSKCELSLVKQVTDHISKCKQVSRSNACGEKQWDQAQRTNDVEGQWTPQRANHTSGCCLLFNVTFALGSKVLSSLLSPNICQVRCYHQPVQTFDRLDARAYICILKLLFDCY